MVKLSKLFYESTYKTGYTYKQPKGISGLIFKLFRRFEEYREDAVCNMLPGGGRLLDIGCGDGNLVFKSLDYYSEIYGMDIAGTRLKVARKKRNGLKPRDRKKIKFVLADADQPFPFKNSFFNAVTLVATLEHFFDPYFILGETKRVLKTGGRIIIEVPNLGYLPRRLCVLTGNLPVTSEDEAGWDGGHLHYFTFKTLKELLKVVGFTAEEETCSGIFAGLRRWWLPLLAADIIISAKK